MRPDPAQEPSEQVRQFVAQFTPEERMLVVLKRELYEGQWEVMEADLHARLEGRPYVFRLVHRIEDDIQRIERLRTFERLHQTDLSEFVPLESPATTKGRGG